MSRLPYFILGLFLFALVNLPKEWADAWRSSAVAAISPAWQSISPRAAGKLESIAKRDQLETLKECLSEEESFFAETRNLETLIGIKALPSKIEREKKILAMRYMSMPAQVIFRDPTSWSSSLWIAMGEADNRATGRTVIARNSPVMAENALVGVVEYVGETQARVRLITDAGISLAVRAVRGGAQDRELSHLVQKLLNRVRVRADLFSSAEEMERFAGMIAALEGRLADTAEAELAKGEICGCSSPLFRSLGGMLRGIGFNYDFADEEGPARDLHSGKPLGNNTAMPVNLIMPGDLLATSGLDGVFPAGLPVAIAVKVAPLKNGSITYDLEAKPAAGDLLSLSTVFVLPPLSFSSESP